MTLFSKQLSTNQGNIVNKLRLAHNQSMNLSSKKFVICLLRILYFIHALRAAFPSLPIIGTKINFKSAYRRANNWGYLAAMSLSTVDVDPELDSSSTLGLVSWRLIFGGSHCPYSWCLISEVICDLANDIFECSNRYFSKIQSPISKLVPDLQQISSSTPLGQALPADVIVPLTSSGKADIHIDDIISI